MAEAGEQAAINQLTLTARIVERKALRYTPAGVPVTECVLQHTSEQVENGLSRKVECELRAVALGPLARLLQGADTAGTVKASGFLVAKSQHSKLPVLHLASIEFI